MAKTSVMWSKISLFSIQGDESDVSCLLETYLNNLTNLESSYKDSSPFVCIINRIGWHEAFPYLNKQWFAIIAVFFEEYAKSFKLPGIGAFSAILVLYRSLLAWWEVLSQIDRTFRSIGKTRLVGLRIPPPTHEIFLEKSFSLNG
jgi:hypothetical protein